MLNKSALTLFITIALVAATPFTIPLAKRTALTQSDGTFDAVNAMNSASRTKSKHEQNLLNFQRNVLGVALSGENAVSSVSQFSRSKIASEPLTNQNRSEWTGRTSIGDLDHSFVLQIDTGSSDLWVPSFNCTSPSCANKNKYDPTKSTTSKAEPGHFFIKYGDQSTVQGAIYTDIVCVAGIQVTDQFLAAASVLSPIFAQEPADGIFGMGFPAIAQLNHTPFFQTAIRQNKVASGVFALYLADSGSELHLGGTNRRHYSGPIEYHPVIKTDVNGTSEFAFWLLDKAEVGVNGKSVPLSPFKTIIDSGTSLFYGPPDEVKKLYAHVPGSQALTGALRGSYSFPCNNVPKISFKWGSGRVWTIPEANFNQGRVSKGSSMCVGALGEFKLPYGSNVWLLGDTFMTSVYTVFNVEEKAVGFAQLH